MPKSLGILVAAAVSSDIHFLPLNKSCKLSSTGVQTTWKQGDMQLCTHGQGEDVSYLRDLTIQTPNRRWALAKKRLLASAVALQMVNRKVRARRSVWDKSGHLARHLMQLLMYWRQLIF